MNLFKIDLSTSLLISVCFLILINNKVHAQNLRDACLLEAIKNAEEELTTTQIKEKCDRIKKRKIKTTKILPGIS